jgi:hypothetical protein
VVAKDVLLQVRENAVRSRITAWRIVMVPDMSKVVTVEPNPKLSSTVVMIVADSRASFAAVSLMALCSGQGPCSGAYPRENKKVVIPPEFITTRMLDAYPQTKKYRRKTPKGPDGAIDCTYWVGHSGGTFWLLVSAGLGLGDS